MNRTKLLREQEKKLVGTNPEPNTPYRKSNGPLMYPGNSIEGRYLELKKRYKEECRKGNKPWRKLNKGQMF